MTGEDAELDELLSAAVRRLEAELRQSAPYLAGRALAWMRQLAHSPHPEDYFRSPLAFPLLRLPWWLSQTCEPRPAAAFLTDLLYSTINGYYYIRLLDNVMDGHPVGGGLDLKLLPAAGCLHTQFQGLYQRYFEPAHPFWQDFQQIWFQAAEVTARDASLSVIGLYEFRRYAARKVSAAKIPLAALCYQTGQLDLYEPWSVLVDVLGAWHQMWNDVFDWNRDLQHKTCTYFLSEAERRRRPNESAAAWIVREGFEWGVANLHVWLGDVEAAAEHLNSPGLLAYLAQRRSMLLGQHAQLADGLRGLSRLAAVLP